MPEEVDAKASNGGCPVLRNLGKTLGQRKVGMFRQMVKAAMGKENRMGVSQVQCAGVAVIAVLASFLLLPTRWNVDSACTMVTLIYLVAFCANLGTQLWVSSVAGYTMFYSMPRHIFGKLQKRLFPAFFLWSQVMSAICIATYVMLHPVESWDRSHAVQALCMLANLLTASVNLLVLAPVLIDNMEAAFQIEVAAGHGDVVGYANFQKMKESDPTYAQFYKTFRRSHGVSVSLTVLSALANVLSLSYLASYHCVPV